MKHSNSNNYEKIIKQNKKLKRENRLLLTIVVMTIIIMLYNTLA